jgi:hypothetical protein
MGRDHWHWTAAQWRRGKSTLEVPVGHRNRSTSSSSSTEAAPQGVDMSKAIQSKTTIVFFAHVDMSLFKMILGSQLKKPK